MKSPKAPTPPDPQATANAQTGTNVATAIANTQLGFVNQNTPDGTLNYNQSGTYNMVDPNSGKTYQIPTYTATTTLSPEQQAIKDQQDQAQLNIGKMANNQSAFLTDYMSKPADFSNDAVEARIFDLARKRYDPLFAERRQQLDQTLSDRGVKMGSDAYDRAMNVFGQQENDAYNNLLLTGHQTGMQDLVTQRNQPINEITALLSGAQVDNPASSYAPANTAQIPTTDYAGIYQQDYANRMANYNAKLNSYNNMMGGLFSLGGSALGAGITYSDIRLKRDVKKIGTADNGLPIYTFRYKDALDDGALHVGVMAQDVLKVRPEAVVTMPDGYMGVNYERALA